jgi:hypothetical protein
MMGECIPDCSNQQCGPDSVCGVSCGECANGEICNRYGKCKDVVMADDMGSNGGRLNGGSLNGGNLNGGNLNGGNWNGGDNISGNPKGNNTEKDMGYTNVAIVKPIGCASKSGQSLWIISILSMLFLLYSRFNQYGCISMFNKVNHVRRITKSRK